MADVIKNIFDIIRECHPREEEDDAVSLTENDTQQIAWADEILDDNDRKIGSVEYASVNKMMALQSFKTGDEISAICHLIESHAVILRQEILHRYLKTSMLETCFGSQSYGLKPMCKLLENGIRTKESLELVLSELPREWYMIQVTAQYEPPDKTMGRNSMHPIHITVLPTGCKESRPFSVTLPTPEMSVPFDVCSKIKEILSNNKDELAASYANNELYWKMRVKQNNALKVVITELEYTWLREWRILFMADPVDDSDFVKDLMEMIDKLLSDSKVSEEMTKRSKWLLKKIVLGAVYLTREEISQAVKYVIPNDDKLASNMILSIYGKISGMEDLKSVKRKTLVLVLDESMDYIPFESMDILKSHPVTRFPSLHIAYALFKEHESSMENGCKVIRVKHNMGTCIVNPSGDLAKMEKRMKLFIEYWLPNWRNWYSTEPDGKFFEDALVNEDILMYNGHGSGIQYLAFEQIERLRVKSVVLLFGCSSSKLITVGGRYPPYGVSNQYLKASGPCVLGMLWEVTDADIDKMTTNFISSWIPSTSEKPWSTFDLNAWCKGTLRSSKNQDETAAKVPMEPEMLRAVAKSKEVCNHLMTAAAIVVRGLPVKLVPTPLIDAQGPNHNRQSSFQLVYNENR